MSDGAGRHEKTGGDTGGDTFPRKAVLATGALFFCSGFVFASWGVHIPTIKDRFGLGEGLLSLAMLSVAAGAVIAMPWVGRLAGRRGSADISLRSGLAIALAIGLLLLMPSYAILIAWLLLFGAATAALDVSMNAQAAIVELRASRPIMSAMHGLFSVGGIAGALLGAAWNAAGGGALPHLLAVGALGAVLTLAARPHLLAETPHVAADGAEAHAARHHLDRHLRTLGILAFLGLVAEGAMYDWTTVYLRDYAHAQSGWINAGYAAFSIGMSAGRFGGDWVRGHAGSIRVLQLSALLCVAGVALAILFPHPLVATLGFGLVGLGTSNMMPVLFSAAAAVEGMPAAEAIAGMARLAYIGLLIGPVMIGALAQAAGLRIGLGLVALAALAVGAGASVVLRSAPGSRRRAP